MKVLHGTVKHNMRCDESLEISFLQEQTPHYKSEHSCRYFPGKFMFGVQNRKQFLRGRREKRKVGQAWERGEQTAKEKLL